MTCHFSCHVVCDWSEILMKSIIAFKNIGQKGTFKLKLLLNRNLRALTWNHHCTKTAKTTTITTTAAATTTVITTTDCNIDI